MISIFCGTYKYEKPISSCFTDFMDFILGDRILYGDIGVCSVVCEICGT